MKPVEIALIGNPNSGKTTLFNLLTGTRQQTGNWPGVTVERKEGIFKHKNRKIHVVDLPGVYMLEGGKTSVDETISRDFVCNHPNRLFINIIDANTLERGLFITTELREKNIQVIVILNMMDIANKRGMQIDIQTLSTVLGCPVLDMSLKKNRDTSKLKDLILNQEIVAGAAIKPPYIDILSKALQKHGQDNNLSRHAALLQIQQDETLKNQIEEQSGDDLDFLLADGRFEYAKNLAATTIKEKGKIGKTTSDKIDRWVLGNWTGVPLFLFLMYLLFLFSINFGGAFIDFFDIGAQTIFVDGFGHLLQSLSTPKWLMVVLANGIGGGIQVVATFIPIIGALFLFLTLLEESGYMARAAFVMDRFMRRLGISGKAFVPLIVGFGCNVPGILATRTLSNQNERILTVMMSPFMSCGARLAVYALFAAAFFPHGGQNIVFLLYVIGVIFAILTGLLLRKTVLRGQAEDFFMELPSYQIPPARDVLLNTWNKLKGFVLGAGKIIIIVVMLINIANSLGIDGSFGNEDSENSVLSAAAKTVTPMFAPMGIEQDNWPATVGIITGLLAKEVVVGTLDALYSKLDQPTVKNTVSETSFSLTTGLKEAVASIPPNLQDALQNLGDPLGLGGIAEHETLASAADANEVDTSTFGAMTSRFNGKIGAFAYLLFILMYFPCVAATGAMAKEVGRGWTLLGVSWTTGLAWFVAVVFYQMANFTAHPLQSLLWLATFIISLLVVIYLLHRAGKSPLAQSNEQHRVLPRS